MSGADDPERRRRETYAEKSLAIGNRNTENIYCKHDGSLEDGVEIVTHPMSMQHHLKHMPWANILAEAIRLGYRSHQSGTCGLHVHISRDSFGETDEEQDCSIARVLFFVERHWNELLEFSRCTHRQLERWAACYGDKDHPTELMEHDPMGA